MVPPHIATAPTVIPEGKSGVYGNCKSTQNKKATKAMLFTGTTDNLHPTAPTRQAFKDLLVDLCRKGGGTPMPEDRGDLRSVTCDPGAVRPGDVFVYLEEWGSEAAQDAMARGAVAVIAEQDLDSCRNIPFIRVPDALRALGWLAAHLVTGPAQKMQVMGVIGSLGRSSVMNLVSSVMDKAGFPCGTIARGQETRPMPHRTHQQLRRLWEDNKRTCLVEASSEDLLSRQLEGVPMGMALLTNLAARNLQRNETLESHLEAMLDLFRRLPDTGLALVPGDEELAEMVAQETRAHVVTYGIEPGCDISGRILRMDENGSRVEVKTPLGSATMRLPLLGEPGVRNGLAALTASLCMGVELDAAISGLEEVSRSPAVLEPLPTAAPFSVVVDGASDPSALDSALIAAGAVTRRRLLVVAGLDPQADDEQAVATARILERRSDQLIVTSGSKGDSGAMASIRQLMRGIEAPTEVMIEPERTAAIQMALDWAQPGDVIFLASNTQGELERDTVNQWFLQGLMNAAETEDL